MREAAERVARSSKKVYEDVILSIIEDVLEYVLKYISYTVALWPEILDRLIDKGLVDPTEEDILETIEELADLVNVENSFNSAPEPVQTIVLGGILAARRIGRRDWFEKMSYEKVLEQARKRNLRKIEHYLVKYPKLSAKIIDWLREKLLVT